MHGAEGGAVYGAALGVDEPAPFVEVFYHVEAVDTEHAQAFVALGAVGVGYCRGGVVEGGVAAVYAARYVDIFGIHEETLVETAYGLQCFGAEQHEATLVVGDVGRSGVVAVGQHVAAVASTHYERGEEAASEYVERRRKQTLCVLLRAVGRDYAWRNLTYAGVGGEHLCQLRDYG